MQIQMESGMAKELRIADATGDNDRALAALNRLLEARDRIPNDCLPHVMKFALSDMPRQETWDVAVKVLAAIGPRAIDELVRAARTENLEAVAVLSEWACVPPAEFDVKPLIQDVVPTLKRMLQTMPMDTEGDIENREMVKLLLEKLTS